MWEMPEEKTPSGSCDQLQYSRIKVECRIAYTHCSMAPLEAAFKAHVLLGLQETWTACGAHGTDPV